MTLILLIDQRADATKGGHVRGKEGGGRRVRVAE